MPGRDEWLENLKQLSVRIRDSANNHKGSGMLYIHDETNVFALTAAHVLNDFAQGDEFFVECQPEKGDESLEAREKYIFRVKMSDVRSLYEPQRFPQDTYQVDDAAVIKLDISGRSWIYDRKKAVFAPKDWDIQERKVAGYGYPESMEEDNISDSTEMADPSRAICFNHTQLNHRAQWKLGITIRASYSDRETNGWSGCVLVQANSERFVMVGIAFAIYEGYAHEIFRGADMHYIRWLLKMEFDIDVNEADSEQDNPMDEEPTNDQIALEEQEKMDLPIPQGGIAPTTVFNLRCFKSMLEGSEDTGYSWAHALRDGRCMEDIEIPDQLHNPASDTIFRDDEDFLNQLLPNEVKEVIFDGSENAPSVEDVMNGSYGVDYKKKVVSLLRNKSILRKCQDKCGPDGLIDACDDRWFVPVYYTFFALMENENRFLRYYQQICDTHNQPQIGMTMFMIYALLGERHFHRLVQSQTKAIGFFAAD